MNELFSFLLHFAFLFATLCAYILSASLRLTDSHTIQMLFFQKSLNIFSLFSNVISYTTFNIQKYSCLVPGGNLTNRIFAMLKIFFYYFFRNSQQNIYCFIRNVPQRSNTFWVDSNLQDVNSVCYWRFFFVIRNWYLVYL